MKVLLFFGLVAVALAEVTRFEGEKVFRLKPVLDEHVTAIKELAKSIEVDFWSPDSAELLTIDIDVDIHVPAMYLDMVYTILQQSGMEYEILIEDLQAAIEGQADNKPTPRAHSYTKYNSWDKIQSWIASISSANSALISKQVIGNTYEGRPMTVLKLGKRSSSTKPAIFMDCGIHAREWISPAFCQWFVKEALSTYGSDSQMTSLLNQMDVFVLPVFNIDGYDFTHKSNRMWRKTRSRKSGSSCIGADPNRNFNAGWCTLGASSNPCSDTFCGYSPESEIEVKNVADFIRRNKSIIKAYITVHSYSQLLLFPYSYTYDLAADHSELLKVAQGASAALRSLYGTRYTSGPGAATIYPAAGGSDDWAYDLGVKYSYTFELRDTGRYGFLLPESQIKPTCECRSSRTSQIFTAIFTATEMLFSVLLVLGVCLVPAHSKQAEEYLGTPLLQSCFEEAKKIVDDAYTYSRAESLRRVRKEVVSPHDTLRLMKQPRGQTRVAVRSADYMAQTLRLLQERAHHVHKRSLNATDLLSREDLERLAEITGCSAQISFPSCGFTPNINKYRQITSICNNLNNPRLGASNTPFTRWLPAHYDDGVSQPKGFNNQTINNFLLPLVRQVSNNILSTTDAGVVSDPEFTHMVTLFGQWNDHDLTFTPFSPSIVSFSNGVNCDESCERVEPCLPIPIPPGDPRLPSGPDSCIPAFRSAPVCGTGNSAFNFGGVANRREQINALTAFLDLSQVYGSEDKLALFLRDNSSNLGLLRTNTQFRDNRRELLPFSPLNAKMCATRARVTNDTNAREVPCFIAGDVRVDENIALTSLHTLFMREHNRLARALNRINPHWDSETLYQEARKIMGAYTQVFVFRDYLPHILGPDAIRSQIGTYRGYSPNVDPSISNVFATAAYRFAHLAIQPVLGRLDANYRENTRFPSVPLFKAFFTPWRIVFEGGIDPLLRGLIGRPAKLNVQNHMMVDALRERLFQFVQHLALDLGSLNMERGRDHGLPGYNAWRRWCGLSQPRNQAELARVLNNADLARRLLQHYGTPDNIDVWMGGVAEPLVPGGRVGPLFVCLIARQFRNTRQGDRLWYQNRGVFTPAQRNALATASLSRIICDNTGINTVPTNVFNVLSRSNRLVRCSSIRSLNLNAWRERLCSENSGPGDSCNEVSGAENVEQMDPVDPEDPEDHVDFQGLEDNEVQ